MFVVLALVTFIVFASLWLFCSRQQKRNLKIPGLSSSSSKEDGNLSDIRAAGGFHEFLTQLHAKYGPIASFWYGQVYTVSIASPELFRQHLHPFDRPPIFFKLFEPIISKASIQYANGEDGRNRRKMYDRAFAHDKLHTYFKTFQKSADVLVKQWSAMEKDELVPLGDETFKFSVRTALCAMLGEYCEDDKVVHGFRVAYLKVQDDLAKVLGDPEYCEKNQIVQKFNEALEFMHQTVRDALEHHRKVTRQGNRVIDEIIEYASDDETVLADCMTYLMGTFQNVGNVLAFSLYYLARHEDLQEKLYNEIMEVLGDNGFVDDSNLKDLKYMHQVIDESIRCGTFGGFSARYQDVDITLGGYKIPKNTPVIQALGVVLRDEKIWPSPEKFDPDRFNEENTKKRNPFAFKPFGFSGKRTCPGFKFVHPKCAVFLASVLRRFQVKLHGEQQIVFQHGMATHTSEEMWVKIVKRK